MAEKDDTVSNWVSTVGSLVFVGGFVAIFVVSALPIPDQQKILILIGLGIAVLVAALIVLALIYRKVPAVAWTINFVVLLLVVLVFALLPVALLGRVEQVLLLKGGAVLFLSLLPGWLYLQFISVRGKTLLQEYILNLHRLQADDYGQLPEPPYESLFHKRWLESRRRNSYRPAGTVEAPASPPAGTKETTEASSAQSQPWEQPNIYLRKFEGHYGESLAQGDRGGARFQGENLFPVLLATLLLAVGWTLVLEPEVIVGLSLLPSSLSLSGKPAIPAEALRFAFLGSYFFVLQMLLRRYFQDDLKTTAYMNVITRIIIVALLVVALHVIWALSAEQEYAFAFFVGIFPHIGLQALQAASNVILQRVIPSLRREYPLSDLDGLNIWYESRLLEEGIEDMQNLATANLVDVILRTRVPVDRLVDWVDQAQLYLRVPKHDGDAASSTQKDGGQRALSSREKLRRVGIRTATDLEDSLQMPPEAGPREQEPPYIREQREKEQRELVEKLRWILNDRKDPKDPASEPLGPSVTQTILKTMKGESNLHHVRQWKAFAVELEKREVSIEADPSP